MALLFQMRCKRAEVLLLKQHRWPIVDSLFIIQKIELCRMYGNAPGRKVRNEFSMKSSPFWMEPMCSSAQIDQQKS